MTRAESGLRLGLITVGLVCLSPVYLLGIVACFGATLGMVGLAVLEVAAWLV